MSLALASETPLRCVGSGGRSRGRAASVAILEEATALNADLLVMGGYAHSRLRELVFGGATRELLRATTIPILMAH